MAYTLSARVGLDMLGSILDAQREQLRRRQARSPKLAGRGRSTSSQSRPGCAGRCFKTSGSGQVEVDPVAAALLCAWASGHMPGLGMLEDRMAETKHPAAAQTAELQPWQCAEAVSLLSFG